MRTTKGRRVLLRYYKRRNQMARFENWERNKTRTISQTYHHNSNRVVAWCMRRYLQDSLERSEV
jgi:hypothetical protein